MMLKKVEAKWLWHTTLANMFNSAFDVPSDLNFVDLFRIKGMNKADLKAKKWIENFMVKLEKSHARP